MTIPNPAIWASKLTDSELNQYKHAIEAEIERRSVEQAIHPKDVVCPSTRVCERHG